MDTSIPEAQGEQKAKPARKVQDKVDGATRRKLSKETVDHEKVLMPCEKAPTQNKKGKKRIEGLSENAPECKETTKKGKRKKKDENSPECQETNKKGKRVKKDENSPECQETNKKGKRVKKDEFDTKKDDLAKPEEPCSNVAMTSKIGQKKDAQNLDARKQCDILRQQVADLTAANQHCKKCSDMQKRITDLQQYIVKLKAAAAGDVPIFVKQEEDIKNRTAKIEEVSAKCKAIEETLLKTTETLQRETESRTAWQSAARSSVRLCEGSIPLPAHSTVEYLPAELDLLQRISDFAQGIPIGKRNPLNARRKQDFLQEAQTEKTVPRKTLLGRLTQSVSLPIGKSVALEIENSTRRSSMLVAQESSGVCPMCRNSLMSQEASVEEATREIKSSREVSVAPIVSHEIGESAQKVSATPIESGSQETGESKLQANVAAADSVLQANEKTPAASMSLADLATQATDESTYKVSIAPVDMLTRETDESTHKMSISPVELLVQKNDESTQKMSISPVDIASQVPKKTARPQSACVRTSGAIEKKNGAPRPKTAIGKRITQRNSPDAKTEDNFARSSAMTPPLVMSRCTAGLSTMIRRLGAQLQTALRYHVEFCEVLRSEHELEMESAATTAVAATEAARIAHTNALASTREKAKAREEKYKERIAELGGDAYARMEEDLASAEADAKEMQYAIQTYFNGAILRQEDLARIDFIKQENRVLKQALGGRPQSAAQICASYTKTRPMSAMSTRTQENSPCSQEKIMAVPRYEESRRILEVIRSCDRRVAVQKKHFEERISTLVASQEEKRSQWVARFAKAFAMVVDKQKATLLAEHALFCRDFQRAIDHGGHPQE